MIGEIVNFDHELQLAEISLHMQNITATEEYNYFATPLANLQDVPCIFPRVENFSITTPVKIGDNCIVFFACSGIDHWVLRGEKEYLVEDGRPEPASRRHHSLTDAIALVGISSFTDVIANFSADNLEIRNTDRTQRITLKPTGEIELTTAQDDPTVESSTVLMEKTGNITVTTTQNLTATVGGDTLLTGAGRLDLDITGNILIKSAAEIEMQAPAIKLTGPVTASETVIATGDVRGAEVTATTLDVSLSTHTDTALAAPPTPGT